MAKIVCKKWFLFQVRIKKNKQKVVVQRATDQTAPDQMTILLNNLPS